MLGRVESSPPLTSQHNMTVVICWHNKSSNCQPITLSYTSFIHHSHTYSDTLSTRPLDNSLLCPVQESGRGVCLETHHTHYSKWQYVAFVQQVWDTTVYARNITQHIDTHVQYRWIFSSQVFLSIRVLQSMGSLSVLSEMLGHTPQVCPWQGQWGLPSLNMHLRRFNQY